MKVKKEKDSFRNVFNNTNIQISDRKTIRKYILNYSQQCIKSVKTDLGKAKFVSTTADIWSGKKRSFLGMTCHWIDEATLERKTVALACRRFEDHTHFIEFVT